MSRINKKLIFPVIALAVLGLGVLDVGLASADENNNPQTTIVQKIAEKFDLNQEEVQQVFDEVRSEHHAEREADMKAKEEERLSQLVADGKITEEQKSLIQQKHEELRAERGAHRDSFKDLSQEERQAQMEQRKSELESWANKNGIDATYLMPEFGERGNGRPVDPGGPKPEGGDK